MWCSFWRTIWGWSDTTLYGHTTYHQTPNIERLAKRGMVFNRAYSASPLCSPTRSAVLTGLSPARTGITTPNCHLPQVVLQASVGKSAAAGLKSIQPETVTRLKTEYRTLAETLEGSGLCDRALWQVASRAGTLFAFAARVRCGRAASFGSRSSGQLRGSVEVQRL